MIRLDNNVLELMIRLGKFINYRPDHPNTTQHCTCKN